MVITVFRQVMMRGMLAATMVLAGMMALHAADKAKVTIIYDGNNVTVKNKVKGVKVTTVGARVTVDNSLMGEEVDFVLSGKTDAGCFVYNGSYKTTITLDGLSMKSADGAALQLNCGKRMNVHVNKGTENQLEDGTDTLHKACIYTKGHLELGGGGVLRLVGHAKNVISAKEYIEAKASTGKIYISSDSGHGVNSGSTLSILGGEWNIDLSSIDKKGLKSDSLMTLADCSITIRMTGDGGQGVKSDGDIVINNAKIDVKTTGNYISEADGWGMGGFGGFGGGFGGPDGDGDFGGPGGFGGFGGFGGGFGGQRDEMNDSTMQRMMEEGRRRFEDMMAGGEMPDFGGFGGPGGGFGGPGGGFGGPGEMGGGSNIEISDSVRRLLFADIQQDERGGGFGGKRKYNGSAKAMKAMGIITINGGDIRLETQTAGAEGLEGKRGITMNDGTLWVKAQDDGMNSGGKIVFNGGSTFVWSMGNDAIDSNSRGAGAITITGGKVVSCSQTGPPEEAFDCDFSPMLLTGGTVFGMGGSMGGEATAPANADDTQPTVVLSGLPCPKGKTLVVIDESGKELFSFDIPFTMQQSSSILSLPAFKRGQTFSVKIKEPDVTLKRFTFDSTIAR
ncbi:MAG: carbohydrate-binding domain-containing protein [Bacteroidaceae bacterium]|nr:carbohydrate-binding domain-containing protein [Bacteroidaceae bacterium]